MIATEQEVQGKAVALDAVVVRDPAIVDVFLNSGAPIAFFSAAFAALATLTAQALGRRRALC